MEQTKLVGNFRLLGETVYRSHTYGVPGRGLCMGGGGKVAMYGGIQGIIRYFCVLADVEVTCTSSDHPIPIKWRQGGGGGGYPGNYKVFCVLADVEVTYMYVF